MSAKPSKKHYKACAPHLHADIAEIARHHSSITVLLLGSEACTAVLGTTMNKALARQGQPIVVQECPAPVVVYATYHPAFLSDGRSPSHIASVEEHLHLVAQALRGIPPLPVKPQRIKARHPRPADSVTISLDIETYGYCKRDFNGNPYPIQRHFNPQRCFLQDGVARDQIITTVALTLIHTGAGQSGPTPIDTWEPGETMVFKAADPHHRVMLREWLARTTAIVGMNLPFDITMLRSQPDLRTHLLPSKVRLYDLAVYNFLQSEVRPERSLKNISLLLGFKAYDDEETKKSKEGQFYADPHDARLLRYNAQDSHATIISLIELARRIRLRYGDNTTKLSDWAARHFSDVVWLCIDMQEVGVPFSRSSLEAFEAELEAKCIILRPEAEAAGLLLDGPGSNGSKYDFMERLLQEAEQHRPETSLPFATDADLEITKKTKKISFTDRNRHFFQTRLPLSHPLQSVLETWDKYAKAQKLLSGYTYPLLRHARKDPEDNRSAMVLKGGQHLVYPTWYPVPSNTKNEEGSGGTVQARITCKNPALQTSPESIKNSILPEREGELVVWSDLAQIELRVPALTSGEPSLLGPILRDEDLHKTRTVYLFTDDILTHPQFKLYRGAGKMTVFADQFRATAKTMRINVIKKIGLNLDPQLYERLEKERPYLSPVLWEWQESLIREAKEKHYLEVPFTGHTRLFIGTPDAIDETYISTICNFPVQTIAGNTQLRLQVLLARRLPGINDPRPWVRQALNVYDAVAFRLFDRSRLKELQEIYADAILELTTRDYWGMLQEHYGRTVPLKWEWTIMDALETKQ